MQTEVLHQRYQAPYYRTSNQANWLQRYWFQGFIFSLLVYVLFNKDISINVGLVSGGLAFNDNTTTTALDVAQQEVVAMPASLHERAPVNVSNLPSKKAPEKVAPVGNTMANLTPILSPSYARRNGIPQAIVEQKLATCRAYVRHFAPEAVNEMKKFGIPASITLAQGLLESNAGESKLAEESNNHFGIKCRSKCLGCTCRNYSDDNNYDMFRVFDTASESYQEHSELLSSGRYAHLKKHSTNYKAWAHGLKKAGYATDKRYAEKLIQIIDYLQLYRYDRDAA